MAAKVTCFSLYSSRNRWLGGVLYTTRGDAEEALRAFLVSGPSISEYDSVIELSGESLAIANADKGDGL